MAKKVYDLIASAGEYQVNGVSKKKWKNIGAEFETIGQDGQKSTFLLIDATVNLAAFPRKDGSESVMISKVVPKSKDAQASSHDIAKSNGYQPQQEDNIPF